MPAIENVDSFLRGNDRIAVEVSCALFKLSKVFDRFQRALRSEETLNVDATQARCFDAAAILLRANVADEVERAIGVAVDVAVEAGDALHAIWSIRFSISRRVELLLRKLGDEQTQSVELLWIENAIEQIVEVVDGDELSLGNIAEIGARGQKDRRRKLGQEVIGDIKVHIETFQPRLLLDVRLREDHAAHGMGDVRQRQIWEDALCFDLIRRHAAQLFPGHTAFQPRRWSNRNRFAARHLHVRIDVPG